MRVQKGFLKSLIDEKKKEFSVKRSISRRTIHTCVYRGSVLSKHRGSKSPLEQGETALVQICIQMGKIRQPLNCTEAIQLMNNLIHNTDTQATLAEFQKSQKLGDDDFKYGTETKA